jgi:hypothetical protein
LVQSLAVPFTTPAQCISRVKENGFCLHRIRPNETAEQTLYCHSTVAMLTISISTGHTLLPQHACAICRE